MEVGYLEVFNKIWHHCGIEWEDRGPTKTFLTDFVNEISSYGFISGEDILLCLILGVAFTILRYLLSTLIFEPFFKWCQLSEKDQKKSPENAFKFLYYCSAYGYCSYILFNGKYNFFQDTRNCWKGWYKGMPVSQDIYILYMVQTGFYFHSMYATVFMDQWRRDSNLMLVHHVIANCLLFFSFAVRYYKIGVIVLFLHDIADIFLEFSKLCVAFKSRGGKYHLVPDVLSNVGVSCFALVWLYCRLYLYPLKVLHSCGCDARPIVPTAPFYFFFNAMLWVLFLMNIWWFTFIVWLLVRIIIGKSTGVEDTREIPEHPEKDKQLGNGGNVANGEIHEPAGDKADLMHNGNGIKRRGENGEHVLHGNEQFRHRQPHTKPASP
ncbi:ceramide synthase 1 [Pocillopora verrucosa]|uniref:ceramide synthase 1 n=1 Tax=Pocillopora verrucosa TaxID=203993 RepID=UPI00279773F4|nr:ceramide synthase 1-like [Pocillopora verrucosa]